MSRKGSLYDFNPRNTGLYEANVWKAYYDRDWLLALALVYRMLRSQFNLGPLQGVLATYYSVRAAVAWAPRDHDTEKVRALLRRFYDVLRVATGAPFDAAAAGDAELEYWVVHRRLDGEKGRPELIDANTRIAAEVYSLSLVYPLHRRGPPASRDRARPTWSTISPVAVRNRHRRRGRLSRPSCAARTASCGTPRATCSTDARRREASGGGV